MLTAMKTWVEMSCEEDCIERVARMDFSTGANVDLVVSKISSCVV